MKDTKVVTLPLTDLVKDGVYLTHTKDLVQIKNIDETKRELHLFNMTEQCNVWTSLDKHYIVRKVR